MPGLLHQADEITKFYSYYPNWGHNYICGEIPESSQKR